MSGQKARSAWGLCLVLCAGLLGSSAHAQPLTLTIGAYRFDNADQSCCKDAAAQLRQLFEDAVFSVSAEVGDVEDAGALISAIRLETLSVALNTDSLADVFKSPRWLASLGGTLSQQSGAVHVDARVYIDPTSRIALSFDLTGQRWAEEAGPTWQAVVLVASVRRALASRSPDNVVAALLSLAYDRVSDVADPASRQQLTGQLDADRVRFERRGAPS